MNKRNIILGLLIALAVAVFLSPLASSSPDGLERVAEDKGFLEKGEGQEVLHSPMPDYVVPGLSNETVAGSAAGFIGTLLTFALMFGIAKVVSKRSGTSVSDIKD